MIENLIGNYVDRESKNLKQWIEKKKQEYPFDEKVEIIRDISYTENVDNIHNFNVYYKKGKLENDMPVIINVHGGGLVYGYKEQNDWQCVEFAKRGYLVFSIEYPMLPKVDIFKIYDDVACAMNYIDEKLDDYHGDRNKVYWVGDSAGAYIVLNLAVIKNSEPVRIAAKVRNIMLPIKALGLISGMFYTTKKDKIGIAMPNIIFGKGYKSGDFAPYINPENELYAQAIPSCFLVTSHNDMLKHHTISFHKYLVGVRKKCKLISFAKNKRLVHAFVALYPEFAESAKAMDEMEKFFDGID